MPSFQDEILKQFGQDVADIEGERTRQKRGTLATPGIKPSKIDSSDWLGESFTTGVKEIERARSEGTPTTATAERAEMFSIERPKRAPEGKKELTWRDKWKEIKEEGPAQFVGFVSGGIEAAKAAKVAKTAWKLDKGEVTEKERGELFEFAKEQRAKQYTTPGYKILDVIAGMPAFMQEFLLTGPAYRVGQKAAMKGIARGLEKYAGKLGTQILEKQVGKVSMKVTAGVAGATLQTPFMGAPRIVTGTIERSMPKLRLSETEKGDLEVLIAGKGEDFVPAFLKSVGDQWAETVSEHSGGLFAIMGRRAKNAAIKSGLLSSFIKANPNKSPNAVIGTFRKMGYHGVLNEMMEERLGEVLRAGIGVQDYSLPTLEQLGVEMVAFAVPGVVQSMGARAFDKMKAPDKVKKNILQGITETYDKDKSSEKFVSSVMEGYKGQLLDDTDLDSLSKQYPELKEDLITAKDYARKEIVKDGLSAAIDEGLSTGEFQGEEFTPEDAMDFVGNGLANDIFTTEDLEGFKEKHPELKTELNSLMADSVAADMGLEDLIEKPTLIGEPEKLVDEYADIEETYAKAKERVRKEPTTLHELQEQFRERQGREATERENAELERVYEKAKKRSQKRRILEEKKKAKEAPAKSQEELEYEAYAGPELPAEVRLRKGEVTYPRGAKYVAGKAAPKDLAVEHKIALSTNNAPWKTKARAENALKHGKRFKAVGFTSETHEIVPVKSGFGIAKKPEVKPESYATPADKFIPRTESSDAKIGERRIGKEGYVDQLQRVKIEDIHTESTNKIFADTVEKYKKIPPKEKPQIMRNEKTGQLSVDDGHHRIAAAVERGETEVDVWIRNSSSQKATHKYMVREALKSGKLTPEKYAELHEKEYGPIEEFTLKAKPEVPKVEKKEPAPTGTFTQQLDAMPVGKEVKVPALLDAPSMEGTWTHFKDMDGEILWKNSRTGALRSSADMEIARKHFGIPGEVEKPEAPKKVVEGKQLHEIKLLDIHKDADVLMSEDMRDLHDHKARAKGFEKAGGSFVEGYIKKLAGVAEKTNPDLAITAYNVLTLYKDGKITEASLEAEKVLGELHKTEKESFTPDKIAEVHKQAVKDASVEGRAVSKEILEGYPDLAEKPEKVEPEKELWEMGREEFKYAWRQSARTEQGVPLPEMDKKDAKNWVGYEKQTTLTVYRGTFIGRPIQSGDFVSTSEEAAKNYGKKIEQFDAPVNELRYVRGSISGDPKLLDVGGQTELIYAPKEGILHKRVKSFEHKKIIQRALKSSKLTPEKYAELHEKDYGPLSKFMPEKVKEATTHLELLKRYVEETGEKIEKKEELDKVKKRYPVEWAKIEKAEAHKKALWDKLPEDFRYNRGINEYTTEELEAKVKAEAKKFKDIWLELTEEEFNKLTLRERNDGNEKWGLPKEVQAKRDAKQKAARERDEKIRIAKAEKTKSDAIVTRALKDNIVDIGQLSEIEIGALNKAVKDGILEKAKAGKYPGVRKNVYAKPGFDFEGQRKGGLEELRGPIKKKVAEQAKPDKELPDRDKWRQEVEEERPKKERRKDVVLRKKIDGLSPEEKEFTIAELRRMNEKQRERIVKLRDIAHRDPLTGLLNRRGLKKKTGRKKPHHVFMDLIGFKNINDTVSHGAGDTVLKAIAKGMKAVDVKNATRWGGDELVFQADSVEMGEVKTQELRDYFKENSIKVANEKGEKYRVTVMFRHGVARTVAEADTLAEEKKAAEPKEWGRGEKHPGLEKIGAVKKIEKSAKGRGQRSNKEGVEFYNPFRPKTRNRVIEGTKSVGTFKGKHQAYRGGFFTQGHYAVKLPEAPDTKQGIVTGKDAPDIKATFPDEKNLAPAYTLGEYKPSRAGCTFVHAMTAGQQDTFFNADYVDVILTKYPDAKLRTTPYEYGGAYGVFDVDGEVVGLAMSTQLDVSETLEEIKRIKGEQTKAEAPEIKPAKEPAKKDILFAERGGLADKRHTFESLKTELSERIGKDALDALDRGGKVKLITSDEAVELTGRPDLRESGVQGFYGDGIVYLLPENIDKGHGFNVLMHELGVHHGYNKIFGEKLAKEVFSAFTLKRYGDDKLGKAIARAFDRVPGKTPVHFRSEEAVAYFCEEHANIDLPLHRKIIARMRLWAVKYFGVKPDIFTHDDYVALAASAMRGEAKAALKEPKREGVSEEVFYSTDVRRWTSGLKPDEEEAIKNTEGATLNDKGLTLDVIRYQKTEQAGELSVRTGVFFLPEKKSPYKKYYTTGKIGYGGTERSEGRATYRNPCIVKAASGGGAPKLAYDAINGKGAYEKMRSDVLNNAWAGSFRQRADEGNVWALLEKYGGNPELTETIIRVSTEGNTLAYAIQEHIVAVSVRKAGFDAVIGYNKIGGKLRLSEIFDVRPARYPSKSAWEHYFEDFYSQEKIGPVTTLYSEKEKKDLRAWADDLIKSAKKEDVVLDKEPPSPERLRETSISILSGLNMKKLNQPARSFLEGLDPKGKGYGAVIEKWLASPEWYQHPVLKKIVGRSLDKSEKFHNTFNEFNAVDDPMAEHDTVAKTLEVLARKGGISKAASIMGKTSSDFKKLETLLDDADVYSEKHTVEELKEKGYSEDIIQTWSVVRESYDKQLDALIKPMKDLVARVKEQAAFMGKDPVYPDFGDFIVEGKKERLTLEQAVMEMGRYRGTYSPRIRERGAWVVTGKIEKSIAEGGTEYFRNNRKSKSFANLLKDDLKRQGYTDIKVEKESRLPEETFQAIRMAEMGTMIGHAASKGLDKYDGEMQMAFMDEIVTASADMIKSRGARATMIRRREGMAVKGYVTDPLVRFVRYTGTNAAGIAKAEMAEKMIKDLYGVYVDGKKVGGIDAAKEGEVHSMARAYIEEQLRNTEAGDRTVGILKGLTTLKFLGFNPRSILVNLSSLTTSVPMSLHTYAMDGKGSLLRIGKFLSIGCKDYTKIMAGKQLPNTDEATFIDNFRNSGYTDAQYTRDATGMVQGAYGTAWSKLMGGSMWAFGKSEEWVRGGTALAAYRLCRKQGLSHINAEKKAINATAKAHGTYGKETLPMVAWGKGVGRLGQAFYTYLKFPHNYMQMLYDAGIRKKNIKGVIFGMAAPAVLGGIVAVPMFSATMAIANAMLSLIDDDRDAEKFVYDTLNEYLGETGEEAVRGGLLGLLDVDISGSLSMGPGAIPTSLFELTGAVGGMAQDIYRGGKLTVEGEYGRAFEKLVPKAVGNIALAIREIREGATTGRGDRVWDEEGRPYMPTPSETAKRALGFRSARRALLAQSTWVTKREERRFKETRSDIYRKIKYLTADAESVRIDKETSDKISRYNKNALKTSNVTLISPASVEYQIAKMDTPTSKQKARVTQSERAATFEGDIWAGALGITDEPDMAQLEIKRLSDLGILKYSAPPSRNINAGYGIEVKLDDDQYSRYVADTSAIIKLAMDRLVARSTWQKWSDKKRAFAVKRVINKGRKIVRDRLKKTILKARLKRR